LIIISISITILKGKLLKNFTYGLNSYTSTKYFKKLFIIVIIIISISISIIHKL